MESVRRALRILQCFDVDHPDLGVTEIATRLGLHKATAHRLLSTLEAEGFVQQNDHKRYRLGFSAYLTGLMATPGFDQREAIQSELHRLVRTTGETAHFAVLDRDEVLYVEKFEGSHRLRLPSAVGRRVPPHCTALGKVLLAAMTDQPRLEVLANLTWERHTSNTICDSSEFLRHLERVRLDGVAFDNQEFEEGLTCVAAPVRGPAGAVVAGVSISGPSPRFERLRDMYVSEVLSSAASMEQNAREYLRSLI